MSKPPLRHLPSCRKENCWSDEYNNEWHPHILYGVYLRPSASERIYYMTANPKLHRRDVTKLFQPKSPS